MKDYIKTYLYNDDYYIWDNIIRIHLVLKKIKLEEQFIVIFIYFCRYGINKTTEKLLLDKGIVKNKGNIGNAKTSLKDKGFIKKLKGNNWVIVSPFNEIQFEDEFNFMVKCKIKS